MEESNLIVFWSPFSLPSHAFCLEFFSAVFARYGDIQCLYCKNMSDKRVLHLMRQADLVVIVLRQNDREIAEYFEKNPAGFRNSIYLIIDYFPETDMSLDHISNVYRVEKKRVVCVPYNTAYQEAVRTGKQKKYLESEDITCIYQTHMDFRRELLRAVHHTLKALEYSAF